MKVSLIITEKAKKGIGIYKISENANLKEAAEILNKNDIGALLVTKDDDEKKYTGLLSERDIIHHCTKEIPLDKIKVKDVAIKDMLVVTSEDTLETARGIMARHHIRHLPVIQDHKISGMITIRDVISVLEKQKEIHIKHLSDFVGGTYGSQVY